MENKKGVLGKLKDGLLKTRRNLTERIEGVFGGRIDAQALEDMEEILITSDLGVKASKEIIGIIERTDPVNLRETLKGEIFNILKKGEASLLTNGHKPAVIMVVGVNGNGKTTTIGKLAKRFKDEGKEVLLVAGDTFRAAAIEQLSVWGERVGVKVVKHKSGADPGAVVFDAIQSEKAKGADVVIVDTAGRLHTKAPLMEELKKIKRVMDKELPGAPHEVLLVIDASTGQNAIEQARIFHEAIGVTGIVLTKLDGTAKGGIIIAIIRELEIPVKMIGIGEKIDDLRDFNAEEFTEALFE
ncbi:MAG: signal recognition particle-docking protein FtsY [Nitrospirota bacterium]